YGLGRRLWGRGTGLLAALLVATSPMLASLFKDFMLDAPLTAMTALALYLLVRSQELARRGASIALGVACGLGMLTKWSFGLYL
ncbi:MAG: 4-amino-4-deoxy-L-arabinose transferase, partial [Thermoleophilia bacterium]